MKVTAEYFVLYTPGMRDPEITKVYELENGDLLMETVKQFGKYKKISQEEFNRMANDY